MALLAKKIGMVRTSAVKFRDFICLCTIHARSDSRREEREATLKMIEETIDFLLQWDKRVVLGRHKIPVLGRPESLISLSSQPPLTEPER